MQWIISFRLASPGGIWKMQPIGKIRTEKHRAALISGCAGRGQRYVTCKFTLNSSFCNVLSIGAVEPRVTTRAKGCRALEYGPKLWLQSPKQPNFCLQRAMISLPTALKASSPGYNSLEIIFFFLLSSVPSKGSVNENTNIPSFPNANFYANLPFTESASLLLEAAC